MKNNNTLAKADFLYFAEFMKKKSGVHLPENEKNMLLVRQRLSKILDNHRIENYSHLRQLMQTSTNPNLEQALISALTTNKTDFFREPVHFDFMTNIIREEYKEFKKLRIWSAAASTGQEAYTISMIMSEMGLDSWDVKILGTDIDLEALKTATKAIYNKQELFGVRQSHLVRYFSSIDHQNKVKQEITSRVNFAPFNLMSSEYPFKSSFDFIFCRNVLIYFEQNNIDHVLTKLTQALKPGGFLFLGVSESGVAQIEGLKPLGSSVFKRILP